MRQDLLRESVLKRLKERGIEIHGRSVFLQGIIFMEETTIPLKLRKIIPYLKELKKLARELCLSEHELALLFVYSTDAVDGIVVGVDNVDQLKASVSATNKLGEFKRLRRSVSFGDLHVTDPDLIDTRKW